MNYTIATLRSYGGAFVMDLSNQHTLFISEYVGPEDVLGNITVLKARANKTYSTREQAKEAFCKLTICVLDGAYSFADRAKIAGMENIYTA